MKWISWLRAQSIVALLAFVLMFAVGFLPLFGGPGYESALAGGLISAGLGGRCAPLDTIRRRSEPFEALSHRGRGGGDSRAGRSTRTIIHGFRVGFCDAAGGTVAFRFLPWDGVRHGGALGALAGEVALLTERPVVAKGARGRARRPSGPFLGILSSLWRFYSTPSDFSFSFASVLRFLLWARSTTRWSTPPCRCSRTVLGSALTLLSAAIFSGSPRALQRGITAPVL